MRAANGCRKMGKRKRDAAQNTSLHRIPLLCRLLLCCLAGVPYGFADGVPVLAAVTIGVTTGVATPII